MTNLERQLLLLRRDVTRMHVDMVLANIRRTLAESDERMKHHRKVLRRAGYLR